MRRHNKRRGHNNQDQGTSDDTHTESYYENATSSSRHKRVGKGRPIEDKKSRKNVTKVQPKRRAPWYEYTHCDSDDATNSTDSGSTLNYARSATNKRFQREKMIRGSRKDTDRAKRRRSMSSNNNDEDDNIERVCINNRKHKKRCVTNPSTRRRVLHEGNSSENSDSTEFKRVNEAKVRKTRPSSIARPSTYYYNKSHSTMERRRYKGDNDDDTESDERPFQRTYKVSAKGSFNRKNGSSDAANSTHLRGNKMHGGSSVNENIIARPNEESSSIASRARGKRRSVVKKTVEYINVTSDSLDESSSSDSSSDSEVKGAYVSNVKDSLSSLSKERFTENNIVAEDIVELSSDEELKENEKQEVPSIKENEDEINKAPEEENEENNTIIADKETSGDSIQPSCDVEREESSPKHVSEEQQQEKEHDKVVSVNRKAPSRKQQTGKKARNEASEKDTETNTVHTVRTDDAPRKRRLEKKTAPCSEQSQPAKSSSEADGMNTLQSPNQLQSEMLTQSEPCFLALVEVNHSQAIVNAENVATEEKECDNEETAKSIVVRNEEIVAADEPVKQVKKKKLSSVLLPNDLFDALADSMMGRGPLIESESEDESRQVVSTITTLPIKFRFEDEAPEPVEKTDFEIEVARLFEEGFGMGNCSELSVVNAERECSLAEETQEARCNRGQHEFRQDEVEGLYCIYCHRVELGPRDILPEWAPKPRRRKPGKKRLVDRDEVPEPFVDERPTEPSVKNTGLVAAAAFKCPDEGTIWDVIPGLREGMFKHQQDGLEYLWKNLAGSIDLAELKNMAEQPNEVGGCMISHAPGTGKSRLTIVFLETYLKVFPESRPLIIAPAGMLLAWGLEFKKWGCPFRYHNLNNAELENYENKYVPKQFWKAKRPTIGTDIARMVKIFSWDREGSVLGISYTLFEKLVGRKQAKDENKESKVEFSEERNESMKQILLEKPGLVIMDEGHIARNETSNLWNAIVKLKTDKRVILSGTPFQNNLGELFNLLRLVRPAVANKIAEDKTLFEINRKSNEIDAEKLETWKNLMLPYVNVHAGTNRRDLPGLRETVIHLKPQELQKRLIGTLVKNQGVIDEHKVTSISVHPYLFKSCGKPEKHPDIDMNLVEASRLNPNEGTKTKFIIELLRLSNAANEKVLIFGQFLQPLELIKEQLKEVFNWDEEKQILHIEGKLLQKKRQEYITKFNDPLSEARVMLASTKCCSEGISLIGASRVVLLDVVWNPSVERQAICRAYRIGQDKTVHIYHLITSGTTETAKHSKQVEKERLSELVFCSSNRETDNEKNQESRCIQDTILEAMVSCPRLTNIFDKIINHPKENFGTS